MGVFIVGNRVMRSCPNSFSAKLGGPLSFLKFSSDSAERTAPFAFREPDFRFGLFPDTRSDSAERTAPFAFQEPDFRFGLFPDTRGSLESLSSRRPLILHDLKIDVRLFIGKGHGDDEE